MCDQTPTPIIATTIWNKGKRKERKSNASTQFSMLWCSTKICLGLERKPKVIWSSFLLQAGWPSKSFSDSLASYSPLYSTCLCAAHALEFIIIIFYLSAVSPLRHSFLPNVINSTHPSSWPPKPSKKTFPNSIVPDHYFSRMRLRQPKTTVASRMLFNRLNNICWINGLLIIKRGEAEVIAQW